MARISPRERRAIALGASLLLAAWVFFRIVPWSARQVAQLRARADLANGALVRARAAEAGEPTARESLAVRGRELVALAPKLLGGTTSAEAAAELSSLVGGTASLRHVRITQQDARSDSGASIFTRVSMRISADGDAGGIGGWLADLEEGPRLIEVRSLAISSPEPAAPGNQPERLHADVVIDGWASLRGTR
ncbi:MAG TPA: GspMb/PilO family protein [Gemmatimonadales bacterium]